MADAIAPHRATIDARAVERVARRLAHAAEPPWLHREIARRMAERLAVIRTRPQTWIDWSGFLGASEPLLRDIYPRSRRIVVEASAALAERSRRASIVPWWSARRWRAPADTVVQAAQAPVDAAQLLWANMSLHASADPAHTLAQWHRALQADGFVMFSTLGPDSLRELRAVYAALGWPPPHAPFVDMHDWGDMLVHAGFADPVMDQERITLTWSSPQGLLDELRLLGGNVHVGRSAGLRTPHWKQRLLGALAERTDADGRIALCFEVVYGHAFRPAPRPARGSLSTVSVDRLRARLPSRSERDPP